MNRLRTRLAVATVATLALASPITRAQGPETPQPQIFADQVSFQAQIDLQFPSRRRNINWDAVPFSGPGTKTLAADFFLASRQILLDPDAASDDLLVSNVQFGDLDATYPSNFPFKSPVVNFKYREDAGQENIFRLADLSTPGAINAFGVVFTDVEKLNVAGLQVLGTDGREIGRFYVQPGASGQNQFLGVIYDSAVIGQVNVLMGELGDEFGAVSDLTDSGNVDVVVVDDFVFMTSVTAIPTVGSAFIRNRDNALVVNGVGFASGSQIVVNGVEYDSQSPPERATTRVASRTAGAHIRPGATVQVQVRNPDGTLGRPFAFTN